MDLPTDSSHYAHRAGRCGRGGRPDVVINLTTIPQESKVPLKLTSALGVDLHTVSVRCKLWKRIQCKWISLESTVVHPNYAKLLYIVSDTKSSVQLRPTSNVAADREFQVNT